MSGCVLGKSGTHHKQAGVHSCEWLCRVLLAKWGSSSVAVWGILIQSSAAVTFLNHLGAELNIFPGPDGPSLRNGFGLVLRL